MERHREIERGEEVGAMLSNLELQQFVLSAPGLLAQSEIENTPAVFNCNIYLMDPIKSC